MTAKEGPHPPAPSPAHGRGGVKAPGAPTLKVDAHTHAFAPEHIAARDALAERELTFAEMYGDPKAKMATCDEVLSAMGRAGFDAAVVAGFAFAAQRNIDALNEHLLHGAREHEGRVMPLATLNPANDGWLPAAERALDSGALGFGELRPHNQGWDPLGPQGRRLCELARERGVALLWHVSEPVGHAYPGKTGGIRPEELYAVAGAFPGLRMVAAHLGGGLPFFLQMPEAREVLRCVAYDTAAMPLLYDDETIARVLELAGAARVLFGSDYPLLMPGKLLKRIQAFMPAEAVEAVSGKSACQIYMDMHDDE